MVVRNTQQVNRPLPTCRPRNTTHHATPTKRIGTHREHICGVRGWDGGGERATHQPPPSREPMVPRVPTYLRYSKNVSKIKFFETVPAENLQKTLMNSLKNPSELLGRFERGAPPPFLLQRQPYPECAPPPERRVIDEPPKSAAEMCG